MFFGVICQLIKKIITLDYSIDQFIIISTMAYTHVNMLFVKKSYHFFKHRIMQVFYLNQTLFEMSDFEFILSWRLKIFLSYEVKENKILFLPTYSKQNL